MTWCVQPHPGGVVGESRAHPLHLLAAVVADLHTHLIQRVLRDAVAALLVMAERQVRGLARERAEDSLENRQAMGPYRRGVFAGVTEGLGWRATRDGGSMSWPPPSR
jgi:hypothetical protein